MRMELLIGDFDGDNGVLVVGTVTVQQYRNGAMERWRDDDDNGSGGGNE